MLTLLISVHLLIDALGICALAWLLAGVVAGTWQRLSPLRSARGGAAIELLVGQVTAPDTTQTALTMNTGNSLTIRNAPQGSKIQLLTAWVDAQLRGILRIRSPFLHDNVQGIRLGTIASEVQPLLDPRFPQMLQPQDTLTVDLSGSATASDLESAALLVRYENLPGADARFIDTAALKSRLEHYCPVENTLSLGTAGDYSGEEAINAEFDQWKNNRDYALVGYLVSPVAGQTVGECAAIRWRGADTGNLGVGGPGTDTDRWLTATWFSWLSDQTGMPCIPIFNASNKGAILIDGVQDENGVDVLVTSIFALLK